MHDALPETGLIAHRKALEAAGIAISLVLRLFDETRALTWRLLHPSVSR